MTTRTIVSSALLALSIALMCSQVNAQSEPLGGQPPFEMQQSVPDLEAQIAYQRAFEAIIWAMPASAIYRFRAGLLEVPGVDDNVAVTFSPGGKVVTGHEAITANTDTAYLSAVSDLRSGPVVLDLPAKSAKASLYGQIVDAWQTTIGDVGPAGLDKGSGGKYLLIPPGYSEPIPSGYLPVQSTSYRIAMAFRSVRGQDATEEDALNYAKQLKIYPLSKASNPGITRFVDGTPQPLHTLPFYDIRALQDIYNIVSVEPVQPRDKVMMGMLTTLGIEPGKPFNPPAKLKGAMEKGVVDAYHYMQEMTQKLFAENLYWPDRHWSFVMVPDGKRSFEFVSDTAVDIDRRAAAWTFFTFYPKTMSEHVGTVYLAPIADSQGGALVAGKTYRLRVPANMPAKQFWSLTVYDNATWAFIQNPLDRAGRGTFNKDQMKVNADGSVDVYFGPKSPTGLESNWIPTMGKKPYVWLRLYGPEGDFWSKAFKMPDVELID